MVIELYTLKWLILYFVNFYINKRIFEKKDKNANFSCILKYLSGFL